MKQLILMMAVFCLPVFVPAQPLFNIQNDMIELAVNESESIYSVDPNPIAEIPAIEPCLEGCKDGNPARMQMWSKFGDFPDNLSMADWQKKARNAIRYYNRENNTNPFSMAIQPGTDVTQTIVGEGMHILVYPPAYLNSKRFMIKKLHNSNSKVTYTVCTAAKKRVIENEYAVTFPMSDPTGTRNVTVDKTRGKVTLIIIQNHTKNGSVNYQVRDITEVR